MANFVELNHDYSYLHKDYGDDDIGESDANHIENSKRYLLELFKNNPQINVDVVKTMSMDGTIAAYLQWYIAGERGEKDIIRKGIAIFEIEDHHIRKRHTISIPEN